MVKYNEVKLGIPVHINILVYHYTPSTEGGKLSLGIKHNII